jgi:hypothetical protein
MTPEAKPRLPLLVRIAVVLTFYNSFVLFEELVVDRRGLWRYLPLYKFGQFCIWDLGAIAGILLVVFSEWHFFAKIKSSR